MSGPALPYAAFYQNMPWYNCRWMLSGSPTVLTVPTPTTLLMRRRYAEFPCYRHRSLFQAVEAEVGSASAEAMAEDVEGEDAVVAEEVCRRRCGGGCHRSLSA